MSERITRKAPVETAVPKAVKDLMKKDWDRRAEEDYKLHIATGHAGSDETFRESGIHDLDEAILDGIELDPAAEVLEIGCGVGRLLVPLSERVAVAHGVDISEVMIRKSRDYCQGSPRVRVQTTDGTLKHLADASLDFVYSFIVFQHIPDRNAIAIYVKEAARVLKPGGLFRFQVDGRWWWPTEVGWKADTYNGVKFSPSQVRDLLVGTDFEIVDEWGQESHYHWITARRRALAPAARATLRVRLMDRALLVQVLMGAGNTEPAVAAQRIIDGSETLWSAIRPIQAALATATDEVFIKEVFRRLLGREPDSEGLAFHGQILKSQLEDRSALIDTIVTGAGFRDLVCPIVPEVAWFRWEKSRLELDLSPESGFFDVVDAVENRLTGLRDDEAVVTAFFLTRGDRPDGDGLRFYRERLAAHPQGRRLLVRELLGKPESRIVPSIPVPERLVALRVRIPEILATAPRRFGESFSGETCAAVAILEQGRGLSDRDFVAHAYERVLGRAVDPGGLEFYSSKLMHREMSRTLLLRELLWSDELRRTES